MGEKGQDRWVWVRVPALGPGINLREIRGLAGQLHQPPPRAQETCARSAGEMRQAGLWGDKWPSLGCAHTP